MHGGGKSDEAIVAVKPANAAEQSAAELVEPRAEAKGNADQHSTGRVQSRGTVSQGLERIRQAARTKKKEKFTSLLHHISVAHLEEAFFALKEKAAAGVDGVTWRAYAENLASNLEDLHGRVQRGAYRALPSRRVYNPSRMAGNVRWRSPRWRTRSSSARRLRCSTRSTRRTSSGSRMGSGPGAARMTRWLRSWSGSSARR